MNRDEIMAVLRSLSVELLDLEADQVQEELSFKEDLDVDSLGLVEITMAIEDELHIKLPEAEVVDIKNIRKFLDLIQLKLAASV